MDELNNKFDKIQEVISFIEVGVSRACVRACFVLATVCDVTYIATFIRSIHTHSHPHLAQHLSGIFICMYYLLFMRTTRRTDGQQDS